MQNGRATFAASMLLAAGCSAPAPARIETSPWATSYAAGPALGTAAPTAAAVNGPEARAAGDAAEVASLPGSRSVGRFRTEVSPHLIALADAQDPAFTAQQPQEPADSRWSDFLPLGRAEVLRAGYDLPRAFGFGASYTRLRRDIEVDEVRVGVNGAPPSTTDFLSVEADSVVDNVMGRLDAWIFPFWNVSLLGGWTWNESDSQVTVTAQFPGGPQDVTFAVPTRQEGPTLGGGTNLAAGYGNWFISGDGMWIWADMSDFAVIEAFLGSIRTGWNGKIDGTPARLWVGATYWDTATTIEGTAMSNGNSLRFEVDQGPVTPYSLQIGGNIDFSRAYGAAIEYHHFKDVSMFVLTAAVRF